jgi:divalent metal cation (Fe/Co/Zn/Cd) transporter
MQAEPGGARAARAISWEQQGAMSRRSLTRYAHLSIGAAILTIALKATAYALTGSVGLLSDALESLVNLAGAVMALAMLIVAARPADDDHAFGHDKAEYFSSMLEGTLILVAAGAVGVTFYWSGLSRTFVMRFRTPQC